MTEIRSDQIVVQDIANDPLIVAAKDVALSDMIGEGFDLTGGIYENKTFDLSANVTNAAGSYISPDGVNMFIVDSDPAVPASVQSFTLSTPGDVSTAITSGSFNPTETGTESGIWMRPDGLMMFILLESGVLNSYTLSVAWSLVSTVTFVATKTIGTATRTSLFIRDDGLQIFVTTSTGTVEQFILTTPWDISVLSSGTVYSVSQDAIPVGISFNILGDRMFVVGDTTKNVYQYDLGTVWDTTTATYNGILVSYGLELTNATDFFIYGTGLSMVLIGDLVKAQQYKISGQAFMKRASETLEGITSLATQAEVDAGTESLKTVTPSTLSNVVGNYLPLLGGNVTGNLTMVAPSAPFNILTITDPQTGDTFNIRNTSSANILTLYPNVVGVDEFSRQVTVSLDTGSWVFSAVPAALTTATLNSHLTRKDYVDSTTVALNGSRTMTGNLKLSMANPNVAYTSTFSGDGQDWDSIGLGSNGNFQLRAWNAAKAAIAATFNYSPTGTFSCNDLVANNAPTASGHLTRKDYVDSTTVALDGSRTMTGDLTISQTGNSSLSVRSLDNSITSVGLIDSFNAVRGLFQRETGKISIQSLDGSQVLQTKLELQLDGNVTVNALAPVNIDDLTRKDYVDSTTVALDGSRAMTGSLIVGDGATGGVINIRHHPADDALLVFRRDTNTAAASIFHRRGDDALIIRKLGLTNDTLTEMLLGSDGNVLLSGGSNLPTASGHLTRKDYVDSRLVTGSDTDRKALLSSNANTITQSGMYELSNTATGLPTSQFYSLLHIRRSASAMTQTAWVLEKDNPASYFRAFTSSIWGAWKRISDTDYVDGSTVALDGSRAMTGNLSITKSSPQITYRDNVLGIDGEWWETLLAGDGSLRIRGFSQGGAALLVSYNFSIDGQLFLPNITPTAAAAVRKDYVDSAVASKVPFQARIASMDANTITTTQVIGSGSGSTNIPVSSGGFGTLYSHNNGADAIQQMYQGRATNGGKLFLRGYDGTTWGAWEEQARKDYVDGSTVALDGSRAMTGDLTIAGNTPTFHFTETDAGVDNQKWSILAAAGGTLRLRATNGAGNSISDFFVVSRTGTIINTIDLNGLNINLNGSVFTNTQQPAAVNSLTRKDYVDGKFDLGIRVVTSSTTSVVDDRNNAVEINSASATNFTIAPNSSVNVPIGTQCVIVQEGTGTITIAPGSGVTLKAPGGKLRTAERYDSITIYQSAINVWRVFGGIL